MLVSMFSLVMMEVSSNNSSNTSSNWEIGITYSNGTQFIDGGVISSRSHLLVYSNRMIFVGIIYLNGQQVEILQNWKKKTLLQQGSNYKIAQGSGDRTITPYSLKTPVGKTVTIKMEVIAYDCSTTSISLNENTINSQDPSFNLTSITNSLSTSNSICKIPSSNSNADGFQFFLLVPTILLL